MRNKLSRIITVFIITTFTLAGCSSGSDDPTPDNPMPTTISGTAQAPSGSIASLDLDKPAMLAALDFIVPPSWAAVTGLTPVANATVELVRIDDDGNQLGAVLANTTTNASGEYTLELPDGIASATDLVVQIKNSSNQPVLRAMVTGDSVDINPVSQFILDTLINQPGLVLANVNLETVQSLVQQVAAIDIDFSVVTTLESAQNTVENNNNISQAVETVASAESVSLIVGAWDVGGTVADGQMLVFSPNGFYLVYSVDAQDCPSGGVEYGTYTFDGTQLELTATLDENGQCGLVGLGPELPQYNTTITNEGNQINLTSGDPEDGTASFARVTDGNPDSIVGGWNIGSVSQPGAIVFYTNGNYAHWQDDSSDSNCSPFGIEYGTYSLDTNSNTLSGNAVVDPNDCGLSDAITGPFTFPGTVTVANNVIQFTDSETFTFDRLGTSDGSSTTISDEVTVSGGKVRLAQVSANQEGGTERETSYILPTMVGDRVDRLEALVAVDGNSSVTNGGRIETDIRLNYSVPATDGGNDYSQYAVIRLRETNDGNGPVIQIFLGMDRTEPDGSYYQLLVEPATDGSAGSLINFSAVQNWTAEAAMSVEWNDSEQKFTFAYDGQSVDLPIALFNEHADVVARGVSFNPDKFTSALLRTRVRTYESGDAGEIAAYYDDVTMDGVLYDDFSTGSLDDAKWIISFK